MFCSKCGAQLPDDANFCMKCGKPQKDGLPTEADETRWEICEIDMRWEAPTFGRERYWFEAEAIGMQGRYIAAKSAEWRGDRGGIVKWRTYLDPMMNQLIAAGWEPIPKGTGDFSFRFRRKVALNTASS